MSFEVGSGEEKKYRERLIELKWDIDRECKKMKEDWETKMKGIKKKLKDIEEEMKKIKKQIKRAENGSKISGGNEREISAISTRWGSEWSIGGSSGLSEKEIGKLKNMMEEKKRYERSKSIVIKGIKIEKIDKIDRK